MFRLGEGWQSWMDQLTWLLSDLAEGERLRLGEPAPLGRPQRLLRQRRSDPTRYVQFIGGADVLVVECVGSSSFGGEWSMTRETETALESAGWAWPMDGTTPHFRRFGRHQEAVWLAEAALVALDLLGADPSRLELSEATSRTVSRHQ